MKHITIMISYDEGETPTESIGIGKALAGGTITSRANHDMFAMMEIAQPAIDEASSFGNLECYRARLNLDSIEAGGKPKNREDPT